MSEGVAREERHARMLPGAVSQPVCMNKSHCPVAPVLKTFSSGARHRSTSMGLSWAADAGKASRVVSKSMTGSGGAEEELGAEGVRFHAPEGVVRCCLVCVVKKAIPDSCSAWADGKK